MLGLLLTTLFVGVGLALVAERLFPEWPPIVRMAIPVEIALVAAIGWAVSRTGLPWSEALGLRSLPSGTLVPLVLVLFGAVTVFSELYVLIQHLAPVPESIERLLRELMEIRGPVDLLATVGVAIIAAPILEEALFRGVLLRQMVGGRGYRSGIAWTAVFFALFHLHNPWQVVPTFFLGLLLAWVVMTTGTLLASIVLHAAFNAVSLILFSIPLKEAPTESAVPWFVAGVVGLLLLGSGALLAGMIRLEDAKKHWTSERTGAPAVGERSEASYS